MIIFKNTNVVGLDATIRGMRNPMNSWDKSDSELVLESWHDTTGGKLEIGPNDLELMKTLVKAGTDHRKFMRMIVVYVDITAPLYWWKEFDTYKVGTVVNSCSTMHKITSEDFDMGSISGERLSDDNHYIMYNAPLTEDDLVISPKQLMSLTIDMLNYLIESYDNEKNQAKKKDIWYSIIQLLPSSYNQRRTVMMSYEVLANIYKSRKSHKLDEWCEHAKINKYCSFGFCDWIQMLPYSELITCDLEGSKDDTSGN